MNLIDRILGRLRWTPVPKQRQETQNPIHTLLEAGQRAKRAEDFDTALEALNRAAQMAETRPDLSTQAAVALHRSEILIYQGRWAEAEQILLHLRRTAQSTSQRTQMAYTLDMLGMLVQAKNDWGEARAFYEQALKVARADGSLGGEGRALGHLADTYLNEGNASYAVHLLREALVKLNTSGDLELSSYFAAQLGHALILTGQDMEGERHLERALRLAEQMNHRRFERHSTLLLGRHKLVGLHYEDAYKYYRQALILLNDQALRVDVLCRLSKICLHLKNVDEALEHARQAVELVNSLDDPALLHQAEGALGMALRAGRHSEQALPYLERAAQYHQQHPEATDRQDEIAILRNLGAARADLGQREEAIATYHAALKKAEKLDRPLEVAQTHLETGLIYAGWKDLPNAILEWSDALTIYEADRYFAQIARLRCDIGTARKALGQGQRAMKEFEQALMVLSSIDDPSTRGIVLSNAANAYADQGDVESAEAFFTEAVTIASRLGDRAAEATRRGNYGWFLVATGRAPSAIPTLEHAMRISQEQKLDLPLAVQTSNLGLAHHHLGNYSAALTYFEQALELTENVRDMHWKSGVQINMGHTLLATGRSEQAAALFDEALLQAQKDDDVEVYVRALTGKAQVALLHGAVEEAGSAIHLAVQRARKAENRRLLAEALRVHSEQQGALGRIEQARSLWEEASKLFTLLHMPGAKNQPVWLDSVTVK